MSSTNTTIDKMEKYKTLAFEYSKLRSTFTVLKDAYKESNSNLTELKAGDAIKDIRIRQQERDIDTLKFRNDEMVHRVGALQAELAKATAPKKKKAKKNVVSSSEDTDVLRVELQNKVEENMDLHRTIFESKSSHDEQISALNEKNNKLFVDLTKARDILESLQKMNRLLEQKINTSRNDIEERDCEINKLNLERQTMLETARVFEEIKTTNFMDTMDLIILDSKLESYDQIDLGSPDQNLPDCKEFISRLSNVLVCTLKALCDLHSSLWRRCLHFISNGSRKEEIVPCLDRAIGHLRELFSSARNSFRISLASLTDLPSFMSCWREYTRAFIHFTEHLNICFDAELSLLGSPSSLKSKLGSTHQALVKYNLACQNIYDVYTPVAECGDPTCIDNLYRPRVIELALIDALNKLFLSLSDLAVNFDSLLSYESELPNLPNELINNNNSLSTTITDIWNNIKEMGIVMENSKSFTNGVRNRSITDIPQFCCSSADEFHKRASSLAQILQNKEKPQHLDYYEAIETKNQLSGHKHSIKTQMEQIEAYRVQISELETEKEHWMLELQLTRAKLKHANLQSPTNENNLVDMSKKMISGGSNDSCVSESTRNEREELILEHFKSRISQISSQLQNIDSKAVFYKSECYALEERLGNVEREREQVIGRLRVKELECACLKDEFEVSVREYGNQLTTMSLLNASLNEQIDQCSVLVENKESGSTRFMNKVRHLRRN